MAGGIGITSLGGYVGVTVGWLEGFELNFFGAVLVFDIRRPALKLPGLGTLWGRSRPVIFRESPNVHAPPGRRQASGCARLLEGTATRRPQGFDRHVPFGRAFEQPRGDARLDAGIADRDVRADVVQNAAQQGRDFGREHVAHPEVLDSDVLWRLYAAGDYRVLIVTVYDLCHPRTSYQRL
jgi:hypothetical protein